MNQEKTILFLGGSITCGAAASAYEKCWAYLTYEKIAPILFDGPCRMINAAISGTGSWVGALRLSQHVLPYKPDLVFIEFAVNDLSMTQTDPQTVISSLDHIIRELVKCNPLVSIAFVYTTSSGKNAAAAHHIVASHYHLPEIDLQTPLVQMIEKGECTWQDVLADVTHPKDRGHALYAHWVSESVLGNPSRFLSPVPPVPSLASLPFSTPRILSIREVMEIRGFKIHPVKEPEGVKHLPELYITEAAFSNQPGDSLSLHFRGTHFAVYHRIGRDGGKAAVYLDGKMLYTLDAFYPYAENYLGEGEYLTFVKKSGLPEGDHVARVEILPEKDPRSSGHRIDIAGFFVG